MSSDVLLDRRFFFRKSVVSLFDCVCSESGGKDDRSCADDGENIRSALWSDFTPEMIQFEAERLGVDPNEKEEIFKRIYLEMQNLKG